MVIFGNELKNGWWIWVLYCLYFRYQLEEEVGSAEEQPTSNRVDTDTVKKNRFHDLFFFFIPVGHNGYKNLRPGLVFKVEIP